MNKHQKKHTAHASAASDDDVISLGSNCEEEDYRLAK